jgi:hypothetical protein
MELIERYLQAVRLALPKSQQDDIVKELRDSILSQVEEKEAALGRPINEEEQAELLKKIGNPLTLAGGYAKQHHLIGAAVFPIYWKVLKVSLGLAFVAGAVGSIATAAAGKPLGESLRVLAIYPQTALMVFACITLTFWALEYFGARLRIAERWDPRKLPALSKTRPKKSRFELIAQLVVQTIFAVWWLAGLHYEYLVFGPGTNFMRFGPIWHSIYWLFVSMALIDLGLTTARLMWPQWTEGGKVTRLVMSALGLVVLYFLLTNPGLFVARNPGDPQMESLVRTINYSLRLGLFITVIVNIFNVIKEAIRLIGQKVEHRLPANP